VAEAVKPLVVVIERDPALSRALTMMLADWGYQCASTESPEMVMQAVSQRRKEVCAVIADADDLGGNGSYRMRDLSRITSALGRTVPTLIASRHASFTRGSGKLMVVAKPFDPDVIRKWLSQWTSRARVI
jgi:DNA-binding NtrC family response regulator